MTETEDACRKRAAAERKRETRPTAFAPPMTETETEDACTKRAAAERKRETRPTAFTPPMTETEDACTKRAAAEAERKRETRPTNSFRSDILLAQQIRTHHFTQEMVNSCRQ